jgi:hypothetical protein
MRATLLRGQTTNPDATPGSWHYEYVQDPDSGAIIQIEVPDDPETTDVDESEISGVEQISLMARGVIDGGIRVAGTTETFAEVYRATDWVKITFPSWVVMTARDRVTNIRSHDGGKVIWANEEATGGPTMFSVKGVTPVVDMFGRHIENFALLERMEING